MKWYIQLDAMLFAEPINPNDSEHEAEEKIKSLSQVHGRGWDAFRVFHATNWLNARSKAEAWWKANKK